MSSPVGFSRGLFTSGVSFRLLAMLYVDDAFSFWRVLDEKFRTSDLPLFWINFFLDDFQGALLRAQDFDDKLQNSAAKISPDYASIIALSTA